MCWGGVITGEKLDGAEGMRGVGVLMNLLHIY